MEKPKPCENTMTGSRTPVTGAVTRSCRSSPRPGAGSTTGLTETVAAAGAKGSVPPGGVEVGLVDAGRVELMVGPPGVASAA